MDPLLSALSSLGLGVASNAVYDWLKARLRGSVDRAAIEAELSHYLSIQGVNVRASTVIDALASKGFLHIVGSTLHAPESIRMGAALGAQFSFGDGSTASTNSTKIGAGLGARITGSGSEVRQNPDGSISFHVGNNPGDGIQFLTGGKPKT